MAAVAFFAAELYKPGLPPETIWGSFTTVCVVFGILVGWFDLGRIVGKGYNAAITYGVRASAVLVFWCLIIFSIYEMILRALKKRYKDVSEALEGVFVLMADFGAALFRVEPMVVLVVGGILVAFLAEWGRKRWP
jgi:hypothetical protein